MLIVQPSLLPLSPYFVSLRDGFSLTTSVQSVLLCIFSTVSALLPLVPPPTMLLSDLLISETGTFKLISKCIENKGFSGTKRYFGDLSQTVSL